MSNSNTEHAVRQESLSLLYRNQQRTLGFTVLGCVVLAAALYGRIPAEVLAPWLAVALGANAWRYLDVRARLRSADFGVHPGADERRAVLFVFVCSSLLGMPLAIFSAALPVTLQYSLALGAVALSAGAAGSMITSRRAFMAYSLPLLGLVALGHLRCASSGVAQCDYLMGAVLLVFAFCIVLVHGQLHRTVLQAMALRNDKDTLLREKEALLIRLEMDNAELLADRDAFLIESLTDGLTGLANRRHFDKTLRRDWDRARREGMCLSCVMLDVDHFKPYNDRHGHGAGDAMLKAVAAAVSACVNRGSDFAARYGGEEFVLLLPGTDLEGSVLLAERIRGAIEKLDFVPDARLTVSAGVASVTPGTGDDSAQRLLALADDALYQAKAQGRNRVVARRGAPEPDCSLPDPCRG